MHTRTPQCHAASILYDEHTFYHRPERKPKQRMPINKELPTRSDSFGWQQRVCEGDGERMQQAEAL